MNLPVLHGLLNGAAGVPRIKISQMNLQEFKTDAGVNTLQFYKGAKGSLYCPTTIGLLFVAKDYNPKSKVQTVIPGFDENGNQIYRLTNLSVAMEL
jgi:hypothetical protein